MDGNKFERRTVRNDEPVVVFLLGMSVRKWWRIDKWLPVALSMPKMMRELESDPALGFLGAQSGFGTVIQYWRSTEDLLRYAQSKDHAHRPAWTHFYQRVAKSRAVGIWHETYAVEAGAYECIYGNVAPLGMGRFKPLMPAVGARESAKKRLQAYREKAPADFAHQCPIQ